MTNEIRKIQIGIFWHIAGRIFGEKEDINIEMHTATGKIDTNFEHWRIWESSGKLKDLQIARDQHEYFSFPRGRVIYDASLSRHIVYCDSGLLKKIYKIKIADFFNIDIRNTLWIGDAHYITDEFEISKLFER